MTDKSTTKKKETRYEKPEFWSKKKGDKMKALELLCPDLNYAFASRGQN